MPNEMTATNNGASSLGTREDISALARRVKLMTPNGNQLSEPEAMALAQISHVTGLNPFIGELWYIPRKGPMVGIRGARRAASESIKKDGGKNAFYNIEFIYVSADEVGEAGNDDILHAYRAELRDSISTKSYLSALSEAIELLKKAGVSDPYTEAKEIVGSKPVWIGYGYSTRSERTKMNKSRAAMKRAEAMAIQQRFSVPFGGQVAAADDYEETDNGVAPLSPIRTSEEMTQDFSDDVDAAFPKDENIVDGSITEEVQKESKSKKPYQSIF